MATFGYHAIGMDRSIGIDRIGSRWPLSGIESSEFLGLFKSTNHLLVLPRRAFGVAEVEEEEHLPVVGRAARALQHHHQRHGSWFSPLSPFAVLRRAVCAAAAAPVRPRAAAAAWPSAAAAVVRFALFPGLVVTVVVTAIVTSLSLLSLLLLLLLLLLSSSREASATEDEAASDLRAVT